MNRHLDTFLAGLTIALAIVAPLVAASLAFGQPTPGSAAPFKAVGHEPEWTLDIGGNRMVLVTDSGATRAEMSLPPATKVEGGRRYEARSETQAVVVTILDRTCADSMTGMPRPSTVEVTVGGRTLKGCGGDSTSVLRGGMWFVEQLRGGPIVEMSRITLTFGSNGRVTGSASCNTYSAGYVLTGEGVTITMPIASMRTCEAPYMAQEAEFLETLRGVNRYELGSDGVLTLHAIDGGTITAKRQVQAPGTPKNPPKPR
jgi:heat shock protein HslJ